MTTQARDQNRRIGTSIKACFLSIFILLFVILSGSTDEIDDWYESGRRATRYEEIKEDLIDIASSAVSQGIPLVLLVSKLEEGAGKRISPARLLNAIQAEASRLERAKVILAESGLDEDADTYRRMSIYLAGGMGEGMILSVIKSSRFDPYRSFATCDALVEIISIYNLNPEAAAVLGGVVAKSHLDTESIEALPAVFLKARVSRIPAAEITSIVVNRLENGDGIPAMNREIEAKGER